MGGGMGVGVKGGWRVNVFLFLLTASQAVLLPWTPLILHAAGLGARAVGATAAVATLASSVGVIISLSGLRRTHNGALRRLMMVMLLTGSTFLQVASVLVLPIGSNGNYPPCGPLSGEISLSDNITFPLQPTHVAQGIVPSILNSALNGTAINATSSQKPVKTTQRPTTTTIKVPETNISHTKKPSSVAPDESVTTEAKPETQTTSTTKPNNDSGVPISGQVHLPSGDTFGHNTSEPNESSAVISEDPTSNTLEEPKSPVDTLEPSENISSEDDSDETDSEEDENEKVPNAYTPNNTENSDSQEQNEPSENISSEDDSDETESEEDENEKVPNSYTPNNTENSDSQEQNESIESSEEEYENDDDDTEDKIKQKPSNHGRKYANNKHNYKNSHKTKQLENTHDSDYGFYYDYDSHGLPSHQNPKLSFRAPKFNSHPSNWQSIPQRQGSHNSYVDVLPDSFRYSNDKQRPINSQRDSVNIISPHQSVLPPPPPPPPETQETFRKESPFMPYSSRIHTQKLYPQKYEGRSQKRVGSHTQSGSWLSHLASESKGRYPVRQKRSPRKEEGQLLTDGKESEGRMHVDISNNSGNSSELLVAIDTGDYSLIGMEVGVSLLLIIGALLGSGVEAAIAQLWHCYAHGYDEGGVSHDILQRTITHTFHLSVYASHNLWAKLTSGAWVLGAGVISIVVCAMGIDMGAFGGLAGMHFILGALATTMVLMIPVPYGSVDPPKTKRPLSLYLDDEVLREGLRRMSFHIWVFATGTLCALSLTFGIWLVQELVGSQGTGLAAQAGAVAVTLVSEGLTLHVQRWLVSRVGLQGVMGVSGLALLVHFAIAWGSSGAGGVVVAHAGLGSCMALLWVSVKHNALLLATVGDQEREAWASWWCWRVGLGIGSAVWGMCVEGAGGSVRPLLMVATLLASIVAIVVGTVALFTRRHWRTRRRVYHTLDLDLADNQDDDDEEEAGEDDWLVKRAKKEGITL